MTSDTTRNEVKNATATGSQRKPAQHESPAGPEPTTGLGGGLQMEPELMLELGQMTLELLVGRSENLDKEGAWEGDFRTGLEEQLLRDPPEEGRSPEDVIEWALRDVLPYATRLDHPRCFAFVPSSPTWPGVLADFMAAAYNINACTWLVASGPSQLELVVLEWFRKWVGYPDGAGGILTSGGSAAAVNAFVAAREAAGSPESAVVYMSNQSHSAQIRAAKVIGVRQENVRLLEIDGNHRLDMGALESAVKGDRAAGANPILVCANAGATSNGAIDPLDDMAEFCASEGIWLHVDASYGGFAMLTETGRNLMRGIEKADSIALDGHKWLFQPYEVGCLLVKDLHKLEGAFAIGHDVLQDTIWGADHPNFSDRSLQLSRSFRALKIWMSIQTFGLSAFRNAVANAMEFASLAGDHAQESSVLELMTPVSLGILCFRVNPGVPGIDEQVLDDINRTVLARLFWEDQSFVSSTNVGGKFALRLCIINHTTTWEDVRRTLEAAERFGAEELTNRGHGT